jgi:hypothetical protein
LIAVLAPLGVRKWWGEEEFWEMAADEVHLPSVNL